MIHVAYRLWGGDGFYAKMLGTSMLSMFENTKEKVTVHIMHNDRLTPDNRGKFCYIAGKYNQRVEFHNVEEIAGNLLKIFQEAYPPINSEVNAAWYPFIIHKVFPNLDKIIFLGADTVFNLDVAELWAYDLDKGGYGIGAVPEICNKLPADYFRVIVDGYVKHEDYFNVDVMLLKPSFFKENFDIILEGLKFINRKRVESRFRHYLAYEQDTLSYLFSKNYLKLPGKFNCIIKWKRELDPVESLHIEKAVYHFADPSSKPSLNTDDVFNKLYLEYFLKTPWATADMFGNLNKAMGKKFEQILNDSRNLTLNVTNLLSERRRAFLVDENFIEAAKQIFAIKPNEPVISLSMDAKNFLQKLNDVKGECLIFVLSNDYWKIRNFLINRNFVEDTDFVNGALFLSERHGVKFNFSTREIVQAI